MVGDVGRFERISVTPAEEDEVVLAGAAPTGKPAPDAPDVSDVPPAAVPEGDGRPVGAAGSRREARRETTLEDLESSPLPFAQKAVIVAAVVCIIGALVYYFVAMR